MSTTLVLLYVVFGLLYILYYYLTRNFKYWEARGVPFEKPLLVYGNLKARLQRTISFHEFNKDFYFKFKGSPYFGMFDGSKPSLHVIDPDLIKNILIKDFDYFQDRPFIQFKQITPYFDKMLINLTGKEWKQVRAILTPAFSSGKLKGMVEIENKCAMQVKNYILDKMKEADGSSTVLDMKETLGKYTMDVIAATAFGVELDSNSHPNSEFAQKIAKFNDMKPYMRYVLFFSLLFGLPKFITRFIPVSFMNVETIQFLVKVLTDTTQKRKQNDIRRNDFLQLLIDAQDGSLADGDSTNETLKNEKGPVLSDIVAMSQAVIFFIAGYETSGTLLTMLFYELAQNEDVQNKLRAEIVEKAEEHGGKISYEMINDIPYLDMVLSETLRLYPPVARLERKCLKEYKLGNVDLEPGMRVFIPLYGIHLDPEYYPEPDKFKPERFSAEEKAKRHPCVYLPFGAGPRNCIGLRFALLSAKICVIHLLREFKVDVCDKTKIPFEYDKRSFLLKASHSVSIRLSKL